jgi:hypothetical protein
MPDMLEFNPPPAMSSKGKPDPASSKWMRTPPFSYVPIAAPSPLGSVMAGLAPAIHVFFGAKISKQDVDARHRRQVYAVCARHTAMAGHDEIGLKLS